MSPSTKFALAAAGLVAAVVLLFIFNSKLPDELKNPSPTPRSGTPSARATEAAASTTPSSPDATATTAGGSGNNGDPSMAVTDTAVTIGVAACASGSRRVDLAQGSITVAISGKQGDVCVVSYTTNTESPGGTAQPTTVCRVPQDLRSIRLPRTATGVDVTPLQQYC